jgi:hypothetical protein
MRMRRMMEASQLSKAIRIVVSVATVMEGVALNVCTAGRTGSISTTFGCLSDAFEGREFRPLAHLLDANLHTRLL